MQVADGRFLHALLGGDLGVRVPFKLRFPISPGAKDCELREPRRHTGVETQMPAELLRQHAVGGRMQKNRERPRIHKPAARAVIDRIHDRLLLGLEAVHRDRGQARGGLLARLF